MSRVSPTLLQQRRTPISATRLVNELGELAGYWLNDETLAAANLSRIVRPALPREIGCCWPVFGVRDSNFLQFLLPAYVLPLQWQATATHDRRLPKAVHDIADQVLSTKELILTGKFSIHFTRPEKCWPDLSDLGYSDVNASSAFASLAAGLSSLQQATPPNPRVWASAVWDGEFNPVDLLSEKLAAARRWGANIFYVPESQADAHQCEAQDVEIRTLKSQAKASPHESLADFFADSYLEPDSDDWETCRRYHAAVRLLNRDKADDFYNRRFFQLIVKRLRHNIWVSPSVPKPLNITHLVTIATQQTEPVKTLVATLGVTDLLVLYTNGPSDLKKNAEKICQECKSVIPNLRAKPASFLYNPESSDFPRDFMHELKNRVAAFVAGVPANNTAFDIDRGLTLHKVALMQQIVQPVDKLLSLYHEMSDRNLVAHGTERILAFQRDESWELPFHR